ncbi:hypothetical protein niasHS_002811 [Heterodera schachtii]|uniref:G-protein coupled receptors family 1 profile domain-containing protein n=1 Tax=Heterodera schachtii TaxID=97005 RepID=A0ABD2K2I6_HETSC
MSVPLIRSLHSNCYVLLALYAVCSCVQQSNFFVPFFCALFGRPFIPYGHCFLLQMAPFFCSFAAFPLTFFIALERFTAIRFPIWYKMRNQRRFLATTVAICAALGLYVFAQDAKTALDNPNQEVICAVGPKVDASFFTLLILLMNLASICLYVAIWAIVKSDNKFSNVQKSLVRCLFVLLLLELFGWGLSISLRLTLTPIFGLLSNSFNGFLIVNLSTNFAYVAMALTTPVLYVFSIEHRDALKAQVSLWKCTNCAVNRISSTDSS